jgi:hypothetical protein
MAPVCRPLFSRRSLDEIIATPVNSDDGVDEEQWGLVNDLQSSPCRNRSMHIVDM